MKWANISPQTVYRVRIEHDDFEYKFLERSNYKDPENIEIEYNSGGPAHYPYITLEGTDCVEVQKAAAMIVNRLGKLFKEVEK